MKISTIIPVYNTSKYLKKCIDSIINQSIGFDNIELILVNDGSTDDSEKIIKTYLKKYKNIKYIYQENSGQAVARNKGLKIASGEYVSFIDSDDYIDLNMYQSLYDIAIEKKLDIVTCDYTFIKENGNEYVSFDFTDDSNKNFIIMNTGPCNMIIKKEILDREKFKFPEGIIYEDLATIPALGIDSKIFHVNKSFYNYLIRKSSTMNKTAYSDKLEDVFISLNNLYDIFKHKKALKKYSSEIEFLYIRRLMMSASLRFISYGDPNNCIKRIRSVIDEKFPSWNKNKYFKKLPMKQKLVAILTYYKKRKILKLLNDLNGRRKR